jgi:catechol 2,3-dioxygenase-like lactoylglutathione lyase family enzyme
MRSTQTSNERAQTPSTGKVDLKLEAVIIPVSDVNRAKRFYGSLGWRLDADFAFDNGFRVVQFTPPGSECSIQFGTKITSAAPGSAQDLYLVVSDIQAAPATARSPPSAIRTAMAGCSRRSRHDFPDEDSAETSRL